MIKKIKKHVDFVIVIAFAATAAALVLPLMVGAITTQWTRKDIAACRQTASVKQKTAIAAAKATYKKDTATAKAAKDKASLKLIQKSYAKALSDAKKTFSKEYQACKKAPVLPAAATTSTPPASDVSCASSADTTHMDIFDAHVHIMTQVSASQIISEMDKAGVSMANLYPIDGDDDSSSLAAISQYPGRFIAFVDTPDSPEPSTWLKQGQNFINFAEAQLKTGKFYGIGETNLRYYTGNNGAIIPPPSINVPADNSYWLQLVDLSAQYHVPISFHFIPDDATANAAFERMLSHNKNATLIWAHLGFNNMTLNSATLNDYLLRYPNLYFDTAGIQNMQNPLSQPNSNWARLANSSNGQLKEEWRQFFETWNSRILFGTDAGGGSNGLERWLNYSGNISDLSTPDAIGHWKSLFAYTDQNTARNILAGNARELFLKEQKPTYDYSVAANGQCHTISVRSESSVSALTFNPTTRVVSFTVAGSNGTTGNAVITIPTALAGTNFTVSVDGQRVESQTTSNSTGTTISLEYTGGIRTITLSALGAP